MASVASPLADFFLGLHKRVAQFGAQTVGCRMGQQGPYTSLGPCYQPMQTWKAHSSPCWNSPAPLATVFDVITAVALSFYYYCSVVPGARIPSPECMQAFLPFIEPHY
eukprot:3808985-Rhodomonas_salina.3